MKIKYNGIIDNEQKLIIENLSKECGLQYDTARLLFCRKIDTKEKIERFLNAGKKNFYNPFLLKDMDKAVNRIRLAKERKEKILIFGDYDVDGICAATVLFKTLSELGLSSSVIIPEREEGYGLNIDTIKRKAGDDISLIITVDCGISEYEKINEIKDNKIDVIVTDHHEPPEILPDCITVNPKISGQDYPFDALCGAGVAYKLAYALIGENANKYLDFTAIATIGDSMELIDENRDIVVEGLKMLNKSLKPCFKDLIGDNVKKITSGTVSYCLSPKLNAGGRMGDANTSFALLNAETDDERFNLAVKLNSYNIARQNDCESMLREARLAIFEQKLYNDSVILVGNENWKVGFIGIVASKLVEEFSKPVIVFAEHDGFYKGSARSLEGINIYDIINSSKDILLSFGGHAQAAGVSVSKDNFNLLRQKLNEYYEEHYKDFDTEKTVVAEWDIKDRISLEFAKEIELLEPFGLANPSPYFTTTVGEITAKPLKEGSPHYSFQTDVIDFLDFNGAKDVELLALPSKKKLLFELNVSSFRGNENVKAFLKGIEINENDYTNLNEYFFEKQLKAIPVNIDNVYYKNVDNIDIQQGYGTIYALSDYENINDFDVNNLPISLFMPEKKDSSNCVVVSLLSVPEGYKKIVYLDTPFYIHNVEIEKNICKNTVKNGFIKDLNTEREVFAKVFSEINSIIGQKFTNISSLYERNKNKISVNKRQFIFVLSVFFELGIFYIANEVIKKNDRIKSALINSKIYCRVCSQKGETE